MPCEYMCTHIQMLIRQDSGNSETAMCVHVYTHTNADETRSGNSGSWNTSVASPENDGNQ